jgi:hypothetical protein
MKKITTIFLLFIFAAATVVGMSSFKPVTPEYYEGKWAVTVKDTPNGTAVIPMRFTTKDGKTKGYFKEHADADEMEMSSVTITGDVITAYFTISGYDVYIALKKVDKENATGSLMDMFTAEAKRVK